MDGDGPPGFKALLLRRRALWAQRSTIADPALRAEFDRLWHLNAKLRAYEWVRAQGHATPDYWRYPSIEEALEATTLDRFAVKPAGGHSSRGVFLLSRRPPATGLLSLIRRRGGYDCAMTGRRYSGDAAVIRRYARLMGDAASPVSREVIVQELMEDAQGYDVPVEYRVYGFATGTPVVLQDYGPVFRGKASKGYEWYDEEGTRLTGIRPDLPSGERWRLSPPPNLSEIFRVARELAAATGVSFLRVDLYNSTRGVVFGEFTPVPNHGKVAFRPDWDRRLGDIWLQNLERLGLDYSEPGDALVRSTLPEGEGPRRGERDLLGLGPGQGRAPGE